MSKEITERTAFPVLGLPFDAVDMQSTVEKVATAVESGNKLFISTPNINFVMASLKDDDFRQSVINSDLSVADGMPIVWIAKLLNIPLAERVSGSGLVEELIKSERVKPIKVFFFGGPEGVAETAHTKLQNQSSGMVSVGWHYPGFGTVKEMSKGSVIDKVNKSGADFVIVALGAKKGQEWIEFNRKKLDAPVVSHLGAVVNFVAGTASRAPSLLQKVGLEWLWRIKEEPGLWKRYFLDGVQLFKLLFMNILPLYLLNLRNKQGRDEVFEIADIIKKGSYFKVSIDGYVRAEHLSDLKAVFEGGESCTEVVVDLSRTAFVEASFLGFLLLLLKERGENLKLVNASPTVKKIFRYNCLDYLLD